MIYCQIKMLQKPRSLAIGTAKKYRNLGDLGEHGWFGEKQKSWVLI